MIDGDNTSKKYIEFIISRATLYGIITYRRVYGDWTNPQFKGWKEALVKHSITPMQQFAYTKGKNATDSALIIDAMDILYTGKVSGFVLASSDSDFTKLAGRLRESGMRVIGIGKRDTPVSFISSCTEFVYLPEENSDSQIGEKNDKLKSEPIKKSESVTKNKTKKSSTENNLISKEEIKNYIDLILEKYHSTDKIIISTIHNELRNRYSDFDYHDYNCSKFGKFLQNLGYAVRDENSNKYLMIKD